MAHALTQTHPSRAHHGLRIAEGIRIDRAVEDVFDFWRDVTNLPRFMAYVDSVESHGDGTSHWVIKGPGGVTLEWDAHLVNEQRPRLIAWESVGSPDVFSAGSVKFTPLSADATDVEVRVQYDPPTIKAGAELAAIMGLSPAAVLREDLRRLKQLLESVEWHAGVDASHAWASPR